MASKGFIELLRLHDRGISRNREQLGESEQLWSGVAFRIGGISLVAPLGEVAEVVNLMQSTMMPQVQSWMKGIANLRGRLLPIVDLADFSGVERLSNQRLDQRKIMVIDIPNLFSGLLVDQVYGIQHFSPNQFVGKNFQVNKGIDPYLQGYFTRDNEKVWQVFMMSKLVQDARYLDASI